MSIAYAVGGEGPVDIVFCPNWTTHVEAWLDLPYRGQVIRSTGDGVLAMFDGAARAVRCAGAIRTALLPHSLDIRAGLHTGEVLVSQAVKNLTVGSDLAFEPRGAHMLKGVPGDWQTYAAIGS